MYLYRMYSCFFLQAEDGIRDLVRSRGLGDVYKRQGETLVAQSAEVVRWLVAHEASAVDLAALTAYALGLSLIHI